MRYTALVQICPQMESGTPPSPEFMTAMRELLAEMKQAGSLIACEVLQPSSQATRLRYAHGKTSCSDGPFAETKEIIGGYLILQANSKDEAIGLAQRLIDLHVEAGYEDFGMELRPMHDSFF